MAIVLAIPLAELAMAGAGLMAAAIVSSPQYRQATAALADAAQQATQKVGAAIQTGVQAAKDKIDAMMSEAKPEACEDCAAAEEAEAGKEGADTKDPVEEKRRFKRKLKEKSRDVDHPLDHAEADKLIKDAKDLGLDVRAKPSDLAGDHWLGGKPHIHVDKFHIPVKPGYQPPPGI